jgi:hypothetical protein
VRKVRTTKKRLYSEEKKMGRALGIKTNMSGKLKSMQKEKGNLEKYKAIHNYNPG